MALYNKPIAKSMLNIENIKVFSLKAEKRQDHSLCPFLFNIVRKVLARVMWQLKARVEIQIGNDKIN